MNGKGGQRGTKAGSARAGASKGLSEKSEKRERKEKKKEGEGMPLGIAPIGRELIIRKVIGEDKMRRHLADMGLCAGERVIVWSNAGGSVILESKGSRIALDRSAAMKILV